MDICDKAWDKLRERKLFHDCLEFEICPNCGHDLEERYSYCDSLYCSECKKGWTKGTYEGGKV